MKLGFGLADSQVNCAYGYRPVAQLVRAGRPGRPGLQKNVVC